MNKEEIGTEAYIIIEDTQYHGVIVDIREHVVELEVPYIGVIKINPDELIKEK
jgi:hypothetical protein